MPLAPRLRRRSLAALPALLCVAAACAPLDRRPLLSSGAYASAWAAIDRAAPEALRGRGRYHAGFGRAEVTAPQGVPLAGYGDRQGAASLGTRDPSYVRAFALAAGERGQPVVVLTADLLLVPPPVARAVRAALRDLVRPEGVFFTASHTHSGPGAFERGVIWELVLGAYDPRAFDAVVEAHVTAARAALLDLAPATIGAAEVDVPGLVMNRVEKGGPTDDRMFVLRVDRDDGRRGALWSFACHAVTLPATSLVVSADYPGEVARELEGRGFDVVGFAAGGVGSSNPRYERESSAWLVRPLVRALRAGLDRARADALSEGTLAATSLEVTMPAPRYRITDETMLWPMLTRTIVETTPARFGALAVGDVVLGSVPGELSGELTRAARAVARDRGVTLALLPFDGSYVGYVVPRRVYDLPAERGEELREYETHTLTFYGPWGGDLMMNLAMRLAAGVHHTGVAARWPKEH